MKKWHFFVALSLVSVMAFCGIYFSVVKKVENLSVTTVATTNQILGAQQRLKEMGYYTGAVDGIYGEQTRQAVLKFQYDYGIPQTGNIGPRTLEMLGLQSSSSQSSDLYLLAKCVYAEARGESYVGKVAVAAVILNRVEHPSFPNTIAGVIYQPWAFTAVYDGQINLEPNQECYNAAQDALNGWDPTYGCIYYYNPSTATSDWIYSRQVVTTIGSHVFAV